VPSQQHAAKKSSPLPRQVDVENERRKLFGAPLPDQLSSAPTATTTTTANPAAADLPAGRKNKPVKKSRPGLVTKRRPRQRPSLSEQLASIGSEAEKITNGLRERHGMKTCSTCLFTTPALLFVVGNLESKSPSPVEFHHTHVSYSFQHPYQTKTRIDMTMQYGHMVNARVRQDKISGKFFEFKIQAALEHYGIDYDPGKSEHVVKIRLASGTDAERIKRDILPRTRR
jgi:hypothetical protein